MLQMRSLRGCRMQMEMYDGDVWSKSRMNNER